MVIRTIAGIAVVSALGIFLFTAQVHAFSLGNIKLFSALNEPFKAEIPVTAIREDEVGTLQVQLASNEEFERAGLFRSFLLTQFQFEIVETARKTAILISSKALIKEPIVDFLLAVTVGSSRIIREYIVLLDPPKNIFVSSAVKTVGPQPSVTINQPESSNDHRYIAPSLSKKIVTNYGPTDKNDTLWSIALKTRSEESVSVHQMIIALLQKNPHAFVDNNINGLKAGYTLAVPSVEEVKQRSKSEAFSVANEQNNLWKNRNKLGALETVVKPMVSDPSSLGYDAPTEVAQPASEEIGSAPIEDKSSRLRLVTSTSDEMITEDSELLPLSHDQLKEFSEQLTVAKEMIEVQAQEIVDSKSLLDMMEEEIETLRRQILVKDASLARLQSLFEEKTVTESSDILTEQAVAADEQQEPVVVPESAPASETPEQISPAPDVEQVDTVNNTLADETAVDDSVVADVLKNIDLSFMSLVDDLISYTLDLSAMGKDEVKLFLRELKVFVVQNKQEIMKAGLLLLLILWFIIRRRNRLEMTGDETINKSVDKNGSVVEVTPEQELDGQEEQGKFEPVKSIEEMIEVADSYISHGDFDKAKLTLLDARRDEPENEQAMYKLLHVLFKQQQTEKFIELAELYQVDTDALNWDEVKIWGRQLAPKHELFNQGIQNINEVEERSDEDPYVKTNELSVDMPQLEPELVSQEAAPSLLDIDDEISENGEEFKQNGLDEIAENDKIVEFKSFSKASDPEVDFDVVDEAETKLDLAIAYIDMGDQEGAKNILEEVMTEGSDEQKTRAQIILSELS